MATAKQKEIEQRRNYVRRLHLRKLTIAEIAKRLNVTEKTIDRDLQLIKEEGNKKIQQDLKMQGEFQEALREHLEAKDEMIRELWADYSEAKGDVRAKSYIMKTLSSIYDEKLNALQRAGLIPQEPLAIRNVKESKEFNDTEKEKINNDFIKFIKFKYQDPLPFKSPQTDSIDSH